MSSMTNGEEPPPSKKMKKKKPLTEPNLIPSLPHDLIVSCLARVSRLHHRTLSLVSKSFRSLLASPEYYQIRSRLGRSTDSCLYVCLRFTSDPNLRWFTLCKKPSQTLTQKKKKEKEKSSGFVLAQIQIMNSPTVEWSDLIAVGSNLFAIKRTKESPPCSNISFLDCRTHTWLEAPITRIAHTDSKFDGKLYLPGSSENQDSSSLNGIEVFNTNTQSWNCPTPPEEQLFEFRSMEGKIYMKKSGKIKGLAYKPKESTWELLELDKSVFDWGYVSMCKIMNITYSYDFIKGFAYTKSAGWRKLKGLEGLPEFARYSKVKLVDYGGNLMVLWDEFVPTNGCHKEMMIWCAEISLERCNNGEKIRGKVEWVDAVLKVPKSYEFVYAIAATV